MDDPSVGKGNVRDGSGLFQGGPVGVSKYPRNLTNFQFTSQGRRQTCSSDALREARLRPRQKEE